MTNSITKGVKKGAIIGAVISVVWTIAITMGAPVPPWYPEPMRQAMQQGRITEYLSGR